MEGQRRIGEARAAAPRAEAVLGIDQAFVALNPQPVLPAGLSAVQHGRASAAWLWF